LKEELSDGKILFGFVRFDLNNTKKLVYISYCGEGVQERNKGFLSNHSSEVGKLVKFFHHQVNARCEEDLDEKALQLLLLKSAGSNYDAGAKVQGNTKYVPTNVAEGRDRVGQSNVKQRVVSRAEYKVTDERQKFWEDNQTQELHEKRALPQIKGEYVSKQDREQFWGENKAKAIEIKSAKTQDYQQSESRNQFWAENEVAKQAHPSQQPVEKPTSLPPVVAKAPAIPPPAMELNEEVAPPPPPRSQPEPIPEHQGAYIVRALYDFVAENESDLNFSEGEHITVLDNRDPSGWWEGEVDGRVGFFPSNFVEDIQ